MADARDLKSRGSDPVPVRPRSPAPYRGVEQLVARRAHNPEAVRFKSHPRNQKKSTPYGCFSFGSEYEIRTSHASGLPEVVGEQVKTPQCGVFTKRYPTKQGVRRAERPQATADDCATGAGNEKFHPRRRRRTTMRPGRAMKSPPEQKQHRPLQLFGNTV